MNPALPKTPAAPQGAWRGYACALGAAGLWALSATLAKGLFSSTLDPLAVAQARSVVGFASLWVLLSVTRPPLAKLPRRHVGFAAAFGLSVAMMHGTYYFAISRMPVAVAILIQYLAPMLVLVYTRCFTRRVVGRRVWLAAILCLAGCALVAGVRTGSGHIGLEGILAGLASAVAYAAYMLLAEAGERRLCSWTLICYGLGFGILYWGILRPWWSFPVSALSWHAVAMICFISVFGTILPYALVALSLRSIPAGQMGITTTAEPVIAAVLAFLILGESLAPTQMAGGGLVLAGIVLAQRSAARGH